MCGPILFRNRFGSNSVLNREKRRVDAHENGHDAQICVHRGIAQGGKCKAGFL